MVTNTFDYAGYYGVDPWGRISQNERPWYDPVLRDFYRRSSVYAQYATFRVDMNGPKARTIYFSDLIPPRPNIAPIGNRQMEASRLHMDSYQKEVTTQRYGNGMALHRESQMFSYWQRNGNDGLVAIINAALGQVITDHLDLLARNAYFMNHYNRFMGNGTATGFDGITDDDTSSTDLLDAVWLGMRDRRMPAQAYPSLGPTGNEMICITTPGFVHNLKREVGTGSGGLNFVEAQRYQGSTALISGELGMYRGFRFVDNGLAKLFNNGAIEHRTTITAAVVPGDGAADPETTRVEDVRRVGQPGATHYIAVDDASGFQRHDIVTIYDDPHDASSVTAYGGQGVIDGPKYQDPMAQDVEVWDVDTVSSPNKLILKEPYMMSKDNGKGLEVDKGGGVFGYVCKARHIHSALFLNPAMSVPGLVAGVAQPPTLYTPPPNDDYLSIYRITYDMWMKYALWEPRAFTLWWGSGSSVNFGFPYLN